MRQPLFGNRLLTNEMGVQWGTEARSKMRPWAEKNLQALKDISKDNERGWCTFLEIKRLRRTRAAPYLYAKLVQSIPWEATPQPVTSLGQWLAAREEDGHIRTVYHIQKLQPLAAHAYKKETSKQLTLTSTNQSPPVGAQEVRIIRTMGPKNVVIDFNPCLNDITEEQTIWI